MNIIDGLLSNKNRIKYQTGGEVHDEQETETTSSYRTADDYSAMIRSWRKLEESQQGRRGLHHALSGMFGSKSDDFVERYHATAPWRFKKKHNIPFLGTMTEMMKWLQFNEGTYRSSQAERNEEDWAGNFSNILDGLL